MWALQEATFRRLEARYERTFGEPPPFTVATLDDAIGLLRERLGAPCGADHRAPEFGSVQPRLFHKPGDHGEVTTSA